MICQMIKIIFIFVIDDLTHVLLNNYNQRYWFLLCVFRVDQGEKTNNTLKSCFFFFFVVLIENLLIYYENRTKIKYSK